MRKTNLLKKVVAVFSAAVLATLSVPMIGGTKEVKAAGTDYILNFSDYESLTAGKVGTDDYFTISNTTIGTTTNKSMDGMNFSVLYKPGKGSNPTQKGISFTTQGEATVTVYGTTGSNNNSRPINLYNGTNTTSNLVAEGQENTNSSQVYKDVFEITEAGTYYLFSPAGGVYFYVKVTEHDTSSYPEAPNPNPITNAKEFFVQYAENDNNYNVRFVYPVAATVADGIATFVANEYTSLGISCTSNSVTKNITGTDVFESVKSGSATVTKSGSVYVVVEITDVTPGASFVVSPIAIKSDGSVASLGSTYSFTAPTE